MSGRALLAHSGGRTPCSSSTSTSRTRPRSASTARRGSWSPGGPRPTTRVARTRCSFTVLNFPVDDVPGTVAALRERGVAFEKYAGTPVETDDDFVFRGGGPLIAWFTDPAGNVLSVIQDDDV